MASVNLTPAQADLLLLAHRTSGICLPVGRNCEHFCFCAAPGRRFKESTLSFLAERRLVTSRWGAPSGRLTPWFVKPTAAGDLLAEAILEALPRRVMELP